MTTIKVNTQLMPGFPVKMGDNPTQMERWLHEALVLNHHIMEIGWPYSHKTMNAIRDAAIEYFGYPIITQSVVEGIIEVALQHGLTTLLGVGSGTGYLEREIRGRTSALKVISTDPNTSRKVDIHCDHRQALQIVSGIPDIGLLLSWPEYHPEMDWPSMTVKEFNGKFLFYIGESDIGCTGTPEMHDAFKSLYRRLDVDFNVPHYNSIMDSLVVYERCEVVTAGSLQEKSKSLNI